MLKEIIGSVNIKVILEIIFKTLLCIVLVGAIGYARSISDRTLTESICVIAQYNNLLHTLAYGPD